MNNIERLQEARRMLQDISMEVVGPVYSSGLTDYDSLDVPESVMLNTAIYDVWQDVLTLYRALRLGSNGL